MDDPVVSGTEESEAVCAGNGGRIIPPCAIVIFGASGDLAGRKLFPALFQLYTTGSLPQSFTIVGAGRKKMDAASFRAFVFGSLNQQPSLDRSVRQEFIEHFFYQELLYDEQEGYARLAANLASLDRQNGTGGNRIFYLAVPPETYPVIGKMLGQVGLSRENENGNGFCRIVVEKPFGRDLESAVALDEILHASFAEHQIFRIDHYLAKEKVQNILMFRFANAIFEPIWNRSYIDYIGIIAAEKLGVEHRAGYYEQSGVIRDMFQNHMMQLLALTAMEPPSVFSPDRVQDEKVKVFRALKPFAESGPEENLILGQYGAGQIDGSAVPAYREEEGVAPGSLTPTFAMLRLFIDNWRWQGVPFYVASGKRLAEKITRIVIQFKEVPNSIFRYLLGESFQANRLVLSIYPQEEIHLTFQAKVPGARICMQTVTMQFAYGWKKPALDAYAKVLVDCIEGDHMLFWRRDGVEQTWSFLDPVLVGCENCSARMELLHPYASGSWGPAESMAWMERIRGE
ncbi:MAG: glucose-6-phosphate dehydrogenase [Deltaproteobacteria bacterium]